MKIKMALAAAAMALMSVSAAQAQLSIVLDLGDPLAPTNVQNATSPSFVTFSGTIFNQGTSAFTIDGDSLALPPGIVGDLPQSDLVIGSFPITLNPGDSFRGDYLFGLDIPASQLTSFGGTYGINAVDDKGTPFAFGADFRVNIQGGAPVPEPGTMALLVSGLIGGSLLMKRRRK